MMGIKNLENELTKPIHNEEEWEEQFQKMLAAFKTSKFEQDGTYLNMIDLSCDIALGILKYLRAIGQL